jgi:hypothetical protein
VHYNSSQPAQLNALAYAQGSDIHLGPGQEQHLPHEAWHVVQQAQGRVRPTMQMREGVPVNDDAGLEREADVMGERAVGTPQRFRTSLPTDIQTELTPGDAQRPRPNGQREVERSIQTGQATSRNGTGAQTLQMIVQSGKVNLVGEEHYEMTKPDRASHIRAVEEKYARSMDIDKISNESDFTIELASGQTIYGDDPMLRIMDTAHACRVVLASMAKGNFAEHAKLDANAQEILGNANRMSGGDPDYETAKNIGAKLETLAIAAEDFIRSPSHAEEGEALLKVDLTKGLTELDSTLIRFIPKDQVNATRSRNMLLSAFLHRRTSDSGVIWKVGNEHAIDLRDADAKELDRHGVTVTEKGEFMTAVENKFPNTYTAARDDSGGIDLSELDELTGPTDK